MRDVVAGYAYYYNACCYVCPASLIASVHASFPIIHSHSPPSAHYISHVSIRCEATKAMVDGHSLSPLILLVVERAERDGVVMLFTMDLEAAGAAWAYTVVLEV